MSGSFDVVQMNLEHGTTEPLIASDRDELMPAWAAKKPVVVYVTNRNGPQEIWLHTEGQMDRPVVTGREFPPETTQWFMGPALSPEADRVVYTRMERNGGGRNWISSVNGGAPVQLTNDQKATEFPGSWSPDGSTFAYIAIHEGAKDLMKVRASGQGVPALVKTQIAGEIPIWSPEGEWILAGDEIISADGKTVNKLAENQTDAYAFAPNGKLLYGIEAKSAETVLFSVDLTGGAKKVIGTVGRQFRPGSNLHPGIRFSISPDGKSIAFGAGQFKSDLWMLEGLGGKR
jgi:Tol biopolymer transport system component